ncbi:MAG: hypothetical protein IKQ44_14620 [Lachnospiraceae bacterium]|nr:hypothetical protein [Lachnospiraceae bacterium]
MMKINQIIKGLFNRNNRININETNNETKFSMKEYTDSEFERLKKEINKDNIDQNKEQYLNDIGEAFERIKNIATNEKYINMIWAQFVIFSTKKINDVPDKLLNHINENNYRTLFDYIKNWVNKEMKKPVEERNSFYPSQVVCEWILDRYNPEDIPALMLLGQMYRSEKDYKKARICFKQIMNCPNGFNGITSLAECYNDEIVDLLEEKRKNKSNKDITNKIAELNKQLRSLYINNISKLKEKVMNGSDPDLKNERVRYVSLVCKYARWNKKNGDYDECIRVLEGIPKDYPEYNRVLLEMALLYQYRGGSKYYNKYYDINKAITVLKQADNLIKDSKDKNARKSVLMPLANSFHVIRDYDEAYRICRLVLDIDPNERNAQELIKQMNNERKIPA